jgi:hypothetical protein
LIAGILQTKIAGFAPLSHHRVAAGNQKDAKSAKDAKKEKNRKET